MSTLTALARAQAVARRTAQPTCAVRHMHVSDRPLVLIPLALAGEANAPLAAMVGDEPGSPQLLIVTQPRNRDQRFAFAAALAELVVGYVEAFCAAVETVPSGPGREPRQRSVDAPQILVPNPAGIAFVRLLGRSTRFRRSYGEYPVDPAVPVLGRWLTFLADRAEVPGSCLLLAATDALALHWASGAHQERAPLRHDSDNRLSGRVAGVHGRGEGWGVRPALSAAGRVIRPLRIVLSAGLFLDRRRNPR